MQVKQVKRYIKFNNRVQ